jgi:peroxiredoxin
MTVKPLYFVPLLMLITLALVFNSCEAPKYYENATAVSEAKPLLDSLTAVKQPVVVAPAENTTSVSSLPSTSVDYLAPDFSLPTADQRQFSLSSFRGKKVLLVFLSTTCEACLKTMQCLLPVYAAWPKDEFEMVFVISGGQFDDVQKWIDLYHVECPVLLDSDGIVLNQYQVKMYPTLYFLTADGHVKMMKSGLMDDCSKQLDTLLRQY